MGCEIWDVRLQIADNAYCRIGAGEADEGLKKQEARGKKQEARRKRQEVRGTMQEM